MDTSQTGHFTYHGPFAPHASNRACEECARKKIRCGMERPFCGLCRRIGANCVYPSHRKKHVHRKAQLQRRGHQPADSQTGRDSWCKSTPVAVPASSSGSTSSQDDYLMNLMAMRQSPPLSSYHCSTQNQRDFLDERAQPDPRAQEQIDHSTSDDIFLAMGLSPPASDVLLDFSFSGFATPVSSPNRQANWKGDDFDPEVSLEAPLPPFANPNRMTSLSRVSDNPASVDVLSSAEHQDQSLYTINLSPDLADHLLEVYFDKVQPSLPLLHRPRVIALFFGTREAQESRYQSLELDSALLLLGMFALAARFSERHASWTCEPKMRGEQYAKKAQTLYEQASREEGDEHLNMRYLQGCILLSWYRLSSQPSLQAWLGVGHCCRLAYTLSLHQVDRDSGTSQDRPKSPEEWCDDEEKRRAVWVIFQMDNFASIIGGRPFSLDMGRMDVLLPVCDEAWFYLRPTKSAFISTNGPASVWSSLSGCENQDAYAWFLVGNYLCRSAQEEFERRDRSISRLKVLRSAIHCFYLGLPLNLRTHNLKSKGEDFREKNWIVTTNFMIHSASTIVSLGLYAEKSKQACTNTSYFASQNEATRSTMVGSPIEQCGRFLQDQVDVIRVWEPEFIPLATPLIAIAIVSVAIAYGSDKTTLCSNADDASGLDSELLSLVVKRFSEYWELGLFCLDVFQALQTPEPEITLKAKGHRSTWIKHLLDRARFLRSGSIQN